MSAGLIWTVILATAALNLMVRLTPIAVLSRLSLPRTLERWLSFIPVSVMASIVAVEVLHPGGRWLAPLENPYLWAAVPTAVVYRFTRSFLGATIAGVLAFLALRQMLG